MGCSLRYLWSQKLFAKPSWKPKRYKCEDHWDNQTPRKTNKIKKTKISGLMDSQNHRENTTTRTPRFQHQWVAKTIEKTNSNKNTTISGSMVVSPNPRSWNRCVIVFVCFLYGFGHPLVLKSCLFLFLFSRWLWLSIGLEILVFFFGSVFPRVLVTNWYWNLGVLVFVVYVSLWLY